jgi:hypothetical protein
MEYNEDFLNKMAMKYKMVSLRYLGIDKPTMYQRLWGWRIGPVMAWRLARITV